MSEGAKWTFSKAREKERERERESELQVYFARVRVTNDPMHILKLA